MLRMGLDETWCRIPESRQSSGGFRLSTIVTVGSGGFRWVATGLRVRARAPHQLGGKEFAPRHRCADALSLAGSVVSSAYRSFKSDAGEPPASPAATNGATTATSTANSAAVVMAAVICSWDGTATNAA